MRVFVFGLGYTANRIADAVRARGGVVSGTGRSGGIDFADADRIAFEVGHATHILSSVPPEGDADPVLDRYGALLTPVRWIGYLSSTGVYGDTGGAWVDENAPTGSGRRSARADADASWLALGARVFRLPGIYGPGRSPLDRVREGRAHRIDVPDQVFSRVHVDDIVSGVIAGFDAPAGAYNLADDRPESQNRVVEYAAALLNLPPPPFVPLDSLSPMARGFYAESRRVANGRAKRVLGWRPAYPDYRLGLRALSAITSPTKVSAAPATASTDQR